MTIVRGNTVTSFNAEINSADSDYEMVPAKCRYFNIELIESF